MAIDSIPYPDTDRLARPDKTFYPVKIPVSHWQLRHYISSPDKDAIYYASGRDVYYLNTLSRKRKHLTTLPFDARCTASGFGWVCIGGEDDGNFAAIKLEASSPERHIDVDAPLPLDYWHPRNGSPRAANVKIERIGEEIVNSISIHQIHDEDSHLYDVVAVLTNNDKTVRIYSLPQALETSVLDLPFPMNHASISPDGTTLVAVGDSNQAFFYTRALQQSPPQIPKPHNRLNMGNVTWDLISIVHLRAGDATAHPGYFTTAWSPNGSLVALGSEGGYITVFDMDLFAQCGPDEAEDAIVAVVASTRPNIMAAQHPGAVRSMLFSPEPWDLLIWAEDQGRVCIGDLRTGLKSKQVIELKPNDEGLKKIELEDIVADESAENDRLDDLRREILNRYREAREPAEQDNFATDLLQSRERERDQQLDRARAMFPTPQEASAYEDDPRGLTAHEQQILEALRTTRQRDEARAQGTTPRSINYTNAGLFGTSGTRPGTNAPSSDSARPFSDVLVNHNDPYAPFPELSRTSQRNSSGSRERDRASGDNTLPPLHSIQEYLLLRDREREAASVSNVDRGASIVRRTGAGGVPTLTSSTAPIPPHAIRANALTSNVDTEDDNPWRSISNAMSLARGPLFESPRSMETRQSRERESVVRTEQLRRLAQQRDRLRGLRREFESGTDAAQSLYDTLTSLRGFTSTRPTAFHDGYEMMWRRSGGREATIGVRTAGLAISQDGRRLWAACEEGIFEIDLQVKLRMMFPAVEMK